MKIFKTTMIALSLSAIFMACEKEQSITTPPVTAPPVSTDKQDPQVVNPFEGLWVGSSVLLNKSIPVYFSFKTKADGTLNVLDATQQVVGTGNWTSAGNHFTATYTTLVTAGVRTVSGDLDNSKLTGTWGYDNSLDNGGYWEMSKIN